jgi:hypothetical protein
VPEQDGPNMAADERATAVSDPAEPGTTRAALFLETRLTGPGGRRSRDAAFDSSGKAFRRACRTLRTQARHLAREAPATARERVRQGTVDRGAHTVERVLPPLRGSGP